MARKLDNTKCTAWLHLGSYTTWAHLPCRSWGNGHCLRDLRNEASVPNHVYQGTCLADTLTPPQPNEPDTDQDS